MFSGKLLGNKIVNKDHSNIAVNSLSNRTMQWHMPQVTRRRRKAHSGPQTIVLQVIMHSVFNLSLSGSFRMCWRAKCPWAFCCLVSLILVHGYFLAKSPFPLSFAFFVIFGIRCWKTCASLGTHPLKQTTLKLSKQPDCCDPAGSPDPMERICQG